MKKSAELCVTLAFVASCTTTTPSNDRKAPTIDGDQAYSLCQRDPSPIAPAVCDEMDKLAKMNLATLEYYHKYIAWGGTPIPQCQGLKSDSFEVRTASAITCLRVFEL